MVVGAVVEGAVVEVPGLAVVSLVLGVASCPQAQRLRVRISARIIQNSFFIIGSPFCCLLWEDISLSGYKGL